MIDRRETGVALCRARLPSARADKSYAMVPRLLAEIAANRASRAVLSNFLQPAENPAQAGPPGGPVPEHAREGEGDLLLREYGVRRDQA